MKIGSIFAIAGLVVLVVCILVTSPTHDWIASQSYGTLFSSDPPARIEIVANGKKAIFNKQTKAYDELLQLLHTGHSDAAFERAGNPPSLGDSKFEYGKIVISPYWIRCKFKIIQSNTNRNYFWIAVPHANGLGTHLPLYALGSEFTNLVEATGDSKAEQGAAANP
jgi:hypothetical protein